MRRNVIICSVLTAAMIMIPVLMLRERKAASTLQTENVSYEPQGNISVLRSVNGQIISISEREYLIGVLAAETDMTYHEEALKAQAVASYTYSLYMREKNLTEELNGAQISDDPQVHQGYLSPEERKEKWDNKFDEYEKTAGEIVDEVYGKAIYYDQKPILAVYHELNSGKTESAETVWNRNEPYLLQKESSGDRLSLEYTRQEVLSYDDFEELIGKIDGVKLNGEEKEWIGNLVKTESGYVKSVEVCGNKVASDDFRTALNLRSCSFSIICDEDEITIRTLGYGHMVGMSQYGADYMARQGADYEEILKYYYSNVEIQ